MAGPFLNYSNHWRFADSSFQPHLLGGNITRCPGLSFVDATAVLPEGCITPEDAGLWCDEQVEPWRQIVEFAHSQNQKISIWHTAVTCWLEVLDHRTLAVDSVTSETADGWADMWAPGSIPWADMSRVPRALTKEGIINVVHAFAEAATRLLKAGFDVIEQHTVCC
ncbi:putative NADPH dehydrogenase C23G7.10c [Grifola frondosa]|uniref:Putative NADPH dehydrogenase C23G7.10c n=1 Tax=Grifola frondosa TaxID=5627 RepID=A0A1C7LNU3_GRIFR|nr:putative NADPH dehydrogenase C23G7.10c [Grifola frondosa]